jgi:hypothetical protein
VDSEEEGELTGFSRFLCHLSNLTGCKAGVDVDFEPVR